MTDAIKFAVTLEPEDGKETEVLVAIPYQDFISTPDGMYSIAPRVARAALAQSGLADAAILHICRSGPTERFLVNAVYANNGGPFGDTVEAFDDSDARFQIAWIMAENQDYKVERISDLGTFLDRIADQYIIDCDPLPISDDELQQAFLGLYKAIHDGDKLEEASRLAGEALIAKGLINEPARTAEVSTETVLSDLTRTLENFCKAQGLPYLSAEELFHEQLTEEQRVWVSRFYELWNSTEKLISAAKADAAPPLRM